ncbi:MAG: dephospho-CoA kinase [Sideroxydans sp.]
MKHRYFGLTGGIGSGKSTVADWLGELGARIIDTDEISRRLTGRNGQAMHDICEIFGANYLDPEGALDRDRMRQLVFSDPGAKMRLQNILHPMILAEAKTQALMPTTAPYTVVVVPLLFESMRYRDWLQRIVVVDCTEEEQVHRTMSRSGLDEATVRSIMGQQIERGTRLRLADEIIHNDGDLAALKAQVVQLHQRLLAL